MRVEYIHVPKCGISLVHTLVYTHCGRLMGSCAGTALPRGVGIVRKSASSETVEITGPEWILRNSTYRAQCDIESSRAIGTHYGWIRSLAPHGVIVLRNPAQRLLSAYKFGGGHVEPVRKIAGGDLRGAQAWWANNFSRYLRYPYIVGCQSRVLLGFGCNDQVPLHHVNGTHAALILERDFKFVGLTDENELSVQLYHRMFGTGWQQRPCPSETQLKPVRKTTKDMSDAEKSSYFTEYDMFAGDIDPDRELYATAVRLFRANLCRHHILPQTSSWCKGGKGGKGGKGFGKGGRFGNGRGRGRGYY